MQHSGACFLSFPDTHLTLKLCWDLLNRINRKWCGKIRNTGTACDNHIQYGTNVCCAKYVQNLRPKYPHLLMKSVWHVTVINQHMSTFAAFVMTSHQFSSIPLANSVAFFLSKCMNGFLQWPVHFNPQPNFHLRGSYFRNWWLCPYHTYNPTGDICSFFAYKNTSNTYKTGQ